MLRNSLRLAFRRFRRRPLTTTINLFGLSIGIAGFLLVSLYVRHESSFDDFHADGDRIYRIVNYAGFADKEWRYYVSGNPIDVMNESYTDVEAAVPLQRCGASRIVWRDMVLQELDMICTHEEFFEIFSFPLVSGSAEGILERPNTIVVTETIAARLGIANDPIGALVPIGFGDEVRDMEVAGVIRDFPDTSTISHDILISRVSLESTNRCMRCGMPMWLKTTPGADIASLEERILTFLTEQDGQDRIDDLRLEPLEAVHFSEIYAPNQTDMRYLTLLSVIAIAILLIACANYTNMSTALAAVRAREIGVRKVLGAAGSDVAGLVLGETFLLTLLALPISLILITVFLPMFNELAQTSLTISMVRSGPFAAIAAGVLMLVGVLSGSYPAFVMSRFRPARIFQGGGAPSVSGGTGRALFRRLLVVFQFACTVILIGGTILIMSQMSFIRDMRLGFSSDDVILVPLTDRELSGKPETVRQAFEDLASVTKASAGFSAPGAGAFGGYRFIHRPEGEEGPAIPVLMTGSDPQFFDLFDIRLVDGRRIAGGEVDRRDIEGVINRTGMVELGFGRPEEIIGERVGSARIVGVMEDFHYRSAHQPIEPLVVTQNEWGSARHIVLKTVGGDAGEILDDLERTWIGFGTPQPFEFTFLDEEIRMTYETEQRTARVFGIFAGIAIAIACLGLFALATHAAERRTKEIGIRKALGAGWRHITVLMSREMGLLIALSIAIAAPVIYAGGRQWLETFAFRTELDVWLFVWAALVAVGVATASTATQIARAVRTDPAESLRYE